MMKSLLATYVLITSIIGAYLTLYVLSEDPVTALIGIAVSAACFYTYYQCWYVELHKKDEQLTEAKEDTKSIPVMGTKTVNYHSEHLDIPTIDWEKPITFDRSKAFYEPKKPM